MVHRCSTPGIDTNTIGQFGCKRTNPCRWPKAAVAPSRRRVPPIGSPATCQAAPGSAGL